MIKILYNGLDCHINDHKLGENEYLSVFIKSYSDEGFSKDDPEPGWCPINLNFISTICPYIKIISMSDMGEGEGRTREVLEIAEYDEKLFKIYVVTDEKRLLIKDFVKNLKND
jgi:hypothetical protein